MKIALVVALQTEFDLVKNIFSTSIKEVEDRNITFFTGNIAGHEVALMKCGIGKVNAAVRSSELINIFAPDLIINTGVAGGLSDDLNTGDIVVAQRSTYHDVWCGHGHWGQIQGLPLFFEGDNKVLEIIEDMKLENIHIGLICTGDQFITEDIGLQDIKTKFPEALAVDMETNALAHVAYQRNIPFLSIRVISDTPNKDSDNTTQYFDFWENAPKLSFKVIDMLLERL